MVGFNVEIYLEVGKLKTPTEGYGGRRVYRYKYLFKTNFIFLR